MMANGWTRETIKEIDRIANAPRQPEPKAGQGKNWLARTQHEGGYARADGLGAALEDERLPRQIPEYVHDRNARRRVETALATWRLPSLGRGKAGYKGRFESKDRRGGARNFRGRTPTTGGEASRGQHRLLGGQ